MKNFSKKVMLMMSLIVASIAFTACSGDDDDDFGGGNTITSNTKLWPAYSSSEKLWGYINENGEWAIKPQFTSCFEFSCGRAEVQVANRKYYYIDTNGNLINGNAIFRDCEDFLNNYALVQDDNNLYGLIDRNCNFVIRPMYYRLDHVASNGLMACKAIYDGKWGYINTSNKKVIDYQFDEAKGFVDGVAAVKVGDSWGLIDANGKYVVNPQYSYLRPIGNGRYAFAEKTNSTVSLSQTLYGMMDTSGKIIMQPKYKSLYGERYDRSGRFAVTNSNDKDGYIDVNGNEVIPCQYKDADVFMNGYAGVLTETGKSYIIDINNNIKINLEDGEELDTDCNNKGLFLISKYEGGKQTYRYINLSGKTVYMWGD